MSSGTSMSSSTSGALRLAEEYVVRGDVKEALSIYRMISESEPSNLDIKTRLGELFALTRKNPDAIKVLSDVARSHIWEGRNAEAAAALNKALELNSSDPDLLTELGSLCGKCGLSAEAEHCYRKAADIYEAANETAKVADTYEAAVRFAPANPELQMKLGAACHLSGRLQDSYRAYMKAAAEFKNRGDERAALDAYGRAVKAALSSAEEESAVADALEEPRSAENVTTRAGPRLDTLARSVPVFEAAAPLQRAVLPRVDAEIPESRSESTDDEPIVGKIATAEILFDLGRFDRAIALLKDLLDLYPNDPRVHRKLTDIYVRCEMPHEAAVVYRDLARVYMAEGNVELAADCMANARRLSGHPRESSLEGSAGGPIVETRAPAAKGWTVVIGRTLAKAAGKRAPLVGDSLGETGAAVHRNRIPGYLAAIILVGVLGITGGYFLIRGSQAGKDNQAGKDGAAEAAVVEVNSTPIESTVTAGDATGEAANGAQADDSEGSARSAERPPSGVAQGPAAQKQPQSTKEPRSATSSPEVAPTAQKTEPPKPTPPALGSIGAPPGTTGAGTNMSPGALATDIPAAPAPPTPRPTVRRSAVMAGGEVVRRVQPVYPLAARSAHITGTVSVELGINEQGNVTSVRASSGPGLLSGAAETAARGFKFKPITLDGVPVKSNRTILFHFKE